MVFVRHRHGSSGQSADRFFDGTERMDHVYAVLLFAGLCVFDIQTAIRS